MTDALMTAVFIGMSIVTVFAGLLATHAVSSWWNLLDGQDKRNAGGKESA